MLVRASSAVTALVALSLLAPVATSAAPDRALPAGGTPTCQGERATIVGASDRPVRGTAGADVIATHGATYVFAGDGDDLICVTGPYRPGHEITVESGTGDDRVRVTNGIKDVTVYADLGPGDDRYRGHDGVDSVGPRLDSAPDGRDVVDTRGGDDSVMSGVSGEPNRDRVELGTGDDSLTLASADNTGAAIDGGPGRDGIRGTPGETTGTWVVDNQARTATRDGVVALTWNGIEGFSLRVADLTFLGSPLDEFIYVEYETETVTADLDGGDDTVQADISSGMPTLNLRGGAGIDVLKSFYEPFGTLTGDVAAQKVTATPDSTSDAPIVVDVAGFDGFDLTGTTVRVIGNARANHLAGFGCHVTVDAGGGDDLLWSRGGGGEFGCLSGTRTKPVLRGNAGDDVLLGWVLDEVLIGGPGDDTARGRAGVDTCRAETRIRCERR